ncbi:hypothetical protein R3P38DRAFT_66926 [Favolaschia claudopus]
MFISIRMPTATTQKLELNRQIMDVHRYYAQAYVHQGLMPAEQSQLLYSNTQKMLKLLEEALSLKGPVASNPETPPDHMHRALLIPEIVWTIVSQLDRTTSDGSGALVALARCKIFHSHALDSLWRFPGSVRRFLACLPDDLWNTPRDGFLRWDTLM